MKTGIMTQDRYTRFFNKYRKSPECISCKNKIHIGEKIESIKGSKRSKYVCGECSEKEILVYQYPKSIPANKIGEKLYAN